MFEDIFTNQGFDQLTEDILLDLDVTSLVRCRLVCKPLNRFIKSMEKSRKLRERDFRTIRRIRRKKFLVHPSWKAIFDGLNQENNFYRRRGLIILLKPYCQEIPLHFDDNAVQSSFLNSIYGTLERVKFFWPYLQDKNPFYKRHEYTPLHFAAYHGLVDVTQFMVDNIEDFFPSLHGIGNKKFTPLHYACRNGQIEIVKMLGPRANFQTVNSNSPIHESPLHLAVENGHLDCVKALLENKGAIPLPQTLLQIRPGQTEPTKIVTHSKTPLGIAKRKEEWSRTPKEKETFSEIVRLLSLGNPECASNINLCDGPPYEPIFPKL